MTSPLVNPPSLATARPWCVSDTFRRDFGSTSWATHVRSVDVNGKIVAIVHGSTQAESIANAERIVKMAGRE